MKNSPLMLSVSGMRGLVGQSLTPEIVARYAAAVGTWLRTTGTDDTPDAPTVILGRDSRPSGEMVEQAAVSGLVATGCRVIRLGIATTPGVAVMVRHLRAQAGIVLTASHNPIQWNGVMVLRHDGVAPPPEQAQQIIDRFHNGPIQYVGVEDMIPTQHNDQTPRVHAEAILPHIDVEAVRKAPLKVVVDSVHGAGGPETLYLLHHLGVELVHLYAEPTGLFPHTPEPTRENLVGLSDDVVKHGAAIGFAQDPDADRLAIVDEKGRYIGEEYTLALAAAHVMGKGDVAAANLSTSRMVDDVAAKVGGTVVRTPVGEANVAAAIQDQNAVIGGEGNGGVIWPKVIHVRDSLVGIALLLEMLAKRGEPLSSLVDEMPAYAIVKDKIPVDPAVVERLGKRMRTAFQGQRIDEQDGVRVDVDDAWVHVRPSNTEPILRLIAEAPDQARARELIEQARQAIGA